VDAHWRLGDFSAANGKPQAARDAYQKAADICKGLGAQLPAEPRHRQQWARTFNRAAWFLATGADLRARDPVRALQLAQKAVEGAPKAASSWNTLGVARYRAGQYKEAIAALEQ